MREVLRTHQLGEAEGVRVALEAEGIEAEVLGEHGFGAVGLASELRVMVPDEDFQRARDVLAKIQPSHQTSERPRSWKWQRPGLICSVVSGGLFVAAGIVRTTNLPLIVTLGLFGLAALVLLAAVVLLVVGQVYATRERLNERR